MALVRLKLSGFAPYFIQPDQACQRFKVLKFLCRPAALLVKPGLQHIPIDQDTFPHAKAGESLLFRQLIGGVAGDVQLLCHLRHGQRQRRMAMVQFIYFILIDAKIHHQCFSPFLRKKGKPPQMAAFLPAIQTQESLSCDFAVRAYSVRRYARTRFYMEKLSWCVFSSKGLSFGHTWVKPFSSSPDGWIRASMPRKPRTLRWA